jgi:hypothetical protein
MLAAGAEGARPSDLKRDLAPLAAHRWSGAAWGEALERVITELQSQGLMLKSSRRLQLTDSGRERARRYLSLPELQRPPRWNRLKSQTLIARALGLTRRSDEVLERVGKVGGLRAEILRRHFELPLEEVPALKQATAALGWKLLERGASAEVLRRVARKDSFASAAVVAALIYTHLGLSTRPEPKGAVELLAARILGSPATSVHKLREALWRRLLDEAQEPAAFELAGFARSVLESARRSPTGRYGEDRVLISHVWRQFQRDGTDVGLNEAGFKQRLLEANRARYVSLARADLAPLLDPKDVAESAVDYLSTTFHLVCI